MEETVKVLIVEDNIDDRKILRYYLDQFGWNVIEAADGAEGFETAMEERPDLIISDGLMPGIDGFELLRKVRNTKKIRDIPFIFYSAVYAGKRDKELAVSLGADAFIPKPKEPEDFLRELKRVLRGIRPEKRSVNKRLLQNDTAYLKEHDEIVAAKLGNKVHELEKIKEEELK